MVGGTMGVVGNGIGKTYKELHVSCMYYEVEELKCVGNKVKKNTHCRLNSAMRYSFLSIG